MKVVFPNLRQNCFLQGTVTRLTWIYNTNTNPYPDHTTTEPGGQVYETVFRLLENQQVPLKDGETRDAQVRSYIPGYMKEKDMVTQLRLEPVSENMATHIRNRKLAVRLKMLLEAKKDGRRKGRLVLQGFRAPACWRVQWCN